MVDDLRCEESRITIFNRPLICRFCGQDVFMPYTTYRNVENPGIQVYFTNYTAVCMHCGYVTQFSDPSGYDPKTDKALWALGQTLIQPMEPEPSTVRIIDEETLNAYKRCLRIALQLLIQEGKAADTVLSLALEEQYDELAAQLGRKTGTDNEKTTAATCLVTTFSLLMNASIIPVDQLISILQNNDLSELEAFLEKHLQ